MRLFRLLFWLVGCLGGGFALSQNYPTLAWQKFYGKPGNDVPNVLRRGLDGNLFLGGTIGRDGKGTCSDAWIIKVDTLGNMLWERQLGGSGCEEVRDLIPTPDSGVIFAGISSSFIEHPEKGQEGFQGDYFLGKLDKTGDIVWLKSFGGLDLDQAYGVVRIRNTNDYLVAGVSHSQTFDVETELPMANAWCVRIGPDGTKKAAFTLGGIKHDWAYSLASCKEGDFVVAGYTNSEDIDGTERRTNGDGWVVRVDKSGVVKWQRVYSGKYEDFFSKVIEDRDGRIVLVGNFESEEKGKQFWFLKITAEGKKLYENIFGDGMDEYFTSVAECSGGGGGYIATGYSKYNYLANRYTKGGEDFWVVRLNGRGELMWSDTYGGRDDERGADILEYRPGVYYALGEKLNNFENGGAVNKGKDFWLLRLEEKSCADIQMTVYTSLTDYQTNVGKNFKVRVNSPEADRILWDFGDGSTSLERETIKSYTMAGVYEVKVTVWFNENCYKTYTLPKYVMVW